MPAPIRSADDDRWLDQIMGRLQHAMTVARISQNEMGKRIGYSQSNLSNWFKADRDQEPRLIPVVKIIMELGLNAGWVFTGKGMEYGDSGSPRASYAQGGLDVASRLDRALREARREFEALLEASTGDRIAGAAAGVRTARAGLKGRPRQSG